MADMRYEQYGPSMGYQPHEKIPTGYPNRPIPISRYGNNPMPNGNQLRMASHQGLRMSDQGRGMPLGDSTLGDRGMVMNAMDDDPSYGYGMPAGRNMIQRAPSMMSDSLDNLSLQSQQMGRQGSYASTPKLSASGLEFRQDPLKAKRIAYKAYVNIFHKRNSVTDKNYVLPSSFLFPQPAITPEHLKSFSVEMLLYIFYSMPLNRLQLQAAIELYARDMVYHRAKQLWYQREKTSANYAQVNCSKVFDSKSCTFLACSEVFKISDIIPLTELNEYLRKAS